MVRTSGSRYISVLAAHGAALLGAAGLGGCGSIPEGKTSYYFPRADTQLVVTQTLACNGAGDSLHQVVSVSATTAYTSDLKVPPFELSPHAFGGRFSDTDITLNFSDDGRLTGINLVQTGQGATLVKDVIGAAKAIIAATAAAAPPTPTNANAACKVIASYGAKPAGGGTAAAGGPGSSASGANAAAPTATLVYAGSFSYRRAAPAGSPDEGLASLQLVSDDAQDAASELEIAPDANSIGLYTQLRRTIPKLSFKVRIEGSSKKLQAARWAEASSSDLQVKLNSVAAANIAVLGPVGDNLNATGPAWNGQVMVPLTGPQDLFVVPVPRAAMFGTKKFTLALSNYGSITKLQYASTGASDVADSASALAGAVATSLTKPTSAQQAAALQAQADLIYQQQRLALCRANPESCTGK